MYDSHLSAQLFKRKIIIVSRNTNHKQNKATVYKPVSLLLLLLINNINTSQLISNF